MDLQLLWDYFGNFNDREFFRIVVILMFLLGTPVAIGVTAKLWLWALRQVRSLRHYAASETAIVPQAD